MEALVTVHVPDGEHVDEGPDPGDDQSHQGRQRVPLQLEGRPDGGHPFPDDQMPSLAVPLEEGDGRSRGDQERRPDGERGQPSRQWLAHVSPEEVQEDRTGQRQRDHEPEQVRHPFSSERSSTEAVARVRKIETMMARPMTTSAAATTRTKKVASWPSMSPRARPAEIKVRLTAFSISSTHMNMTRALRRTRMPRAPIENRIAASNMYQSVTGWTSRAGSRRGRSPRLLPPSEAAL